MMLTLVLASSALSLSTPLSASERPPAPSAEAQWDGTVITVRGQRDKRESRETIAEFVAALTPYRTARPQMTFEREVCPLVLGLPQRQAAAMSARIRQVAASVQMRVGGEECGRNLFVLITAGKRKLLDAMRRSAKEAFGTLSRDKIRALYRQPGPAVVWHSQGPPVARDGKEAFFNDNLQYYFNITTEAATRMNSGAALQFATATVVIERQALDGLTVTQLADYVALRAFTAADPQRLGASPVPTILRVLDAPLDALVPASLTAWDLAFLRGFANSERGDSAVTVRSSIAKDLEQDLVRRP